MEKVTKMNNNISCGFPWGSKLRRHLHPICLENDDTYRYYASINAWPLTAQQEPIFIVADKGTPISKVTLPPVFTIGWDMMVHENIAKILKKLSLGKTTLKKTPIGKMVKGKFERTFDDEWYFFHVGESHETLVPLKEDGMSVANPNPGSITAPITLVDGKIAVKKKFEHTNIDVWRDPIWDLGLFVSPKLRFEIKNAGLSKHWPMVTCRWASPEEENRRILGYNPSHYAMASYKKL